MVACACELGGPFFHRHHVAFMFSFLSFLWTALVLLWACPFECFWFFTVAHIVPDVHISKTICTYCMLWNWLELLWFFL